MGGHLGLALAGEDALAITEDAAHAVFRGEIREVPDMLTDDEIKALLAYLRRLK